MTGHSLLELMTCLALIALLTSMAIPALRAWQDNASARLSANQLMGALHYARSTAVHGSSTIALCSGTTHCTHKDAWHEHVLIFNDMNKDGQLNPNEELLGLLTIKGDHFWVWKGFRRTNYLQYQANGTTRGHNGTFTLCTRELKAVREIRVNTTGRAQIRPARGDKNCEGAAVRR